jgi:hypothetical protein
MGRHSQGPSSAARDEPMGGEIVRISGLRV